MAGFNGKWKMVDHKNLQPYHDLIKTPAAYQEKLRTIIKASMADPDAYIEELQVDLPGKTVFRTVYVNGEKTREVKLPIGATSDINAADGRSYKGTLTFESDTKFKYHQKGAEFEATQTFELIGDTLEVTLSSGSVSGTQTYKR